MKGRCRNPKNKSYPDYGGRGITVCDEWLHFAAFLAWGLANGYAPGLMIDRIDNNGNYEPGNVRFTTRIKQNRNKRTNVLLTAFGETKPLSEWAEDPRSAVRMSTLWERIRKGWDHFTAITTPPDPSKIGRRKKDPPFQPPTLF